MDLSIFVKYIKYLILVKKKLTVDRSHYSNSNKISKVVIFKVKSIKVDTNIRIYTYNIWIYHVYEFLWLYEYFRYNKCNCVYELGIL